MISYRLIHWIIPQLLAENGTIKSKREKWVLLKKVDTNGKHTLHLRVLVEKIAIVTKVGLKFVKEITKIVGHSIQIRILFLNQKPVHIVKHVIISQR